jgi:hypothetical protein
VPRVELRIIQPTVESPHQMIAAVVFIGGASVMSRLLIRTLSRGTGIYPGLEGSNQQVCGSAQSNTDTGALDRELSLRQWNVYKDANEK